MKLLKYLGLLLLILGAGVFTVPKLAHASVAPGGIIDKTLFKAAQTVDISADVNGDVFCAGQTVTINGTVKGDLICAAQTININGKIEGNIRVAAQTINLNGTAGRSASMAGQIINISAGSSIGSDISAFAETINVNGKIKRDALLSGASVVVNNEIGRNLSGSVENLSLTSSAIVGGNVDYTSKTDASVANGAQIKGTIARTTPKTNEPSKGTSIFFSVFSMIALLFAAFILALVAPKLFQKASETAITNPGKTIGVGLAALILTPVVIILMLTTVIGIPLAILLGLIWAATMCLSMPFAAYYAGRLALSRTKFKNALLYMLAGAPIILILGRIPFLGFFFTVISLSAGLGMILLTLASHYEKPSYRVK